MREGEPVDDGTEATDEPAPRRLGGVWGLLAIVLVVALALGGGYLLNRNKGNPANGFETVAAAGPPLRVGEQAPDFTATTLDGKQLKLSDLRGQGVWLTFGASWCTACRAEAPDIEAAYRSRPDGTTVLGIWMGEDASRVRDYTAKLGASYPQVPDPQSAITGQYRVFGVPLHVFVGPDGRVRSVHQGILSRETMTKELAGLRTA